MNLRLVIGRDRAGNIVLTWHELVRHVLLTGKTGLGKSTLLLAIIIQLAKQRCPFGLLDPDGKTARDGYALCNETRIPSVFLRPSEKQFRYDPFKTDLTGAAYEQWLEAKITNIGTFMASKHGQADYSEQHRRYRVMQNVLYLCGTKVNGKHLGLHKALACLEFNDYWDNHIFKPVCRHLPHHVAADLYRLRYTPEVQRMREIESTINWFRHFLGGISEMFRPGDSLNFNRLLTMPLFVDLEETRFFSSEQATALGAMLKNELLDECYDMKTPYVLILEEAEKLLGHDVGDALARARKRSVALILSVQDLGGLAK